MHLVLVKPITIVRPSSLLRIHSLLNSSLGLPKLCFFTSCRTLQLESQTSLPYIYCELGLNLRIKPRRRLKGYVPELLKESILENQD